MKSVILSLGSRTLPTACQTAPIVQAKAEFPDSTGMKKAPGYVAANRLYRDDAEVAVQVRYLTEGLKIELLSCYKQYDEVKKTLDKFKAENNSKTGLNSLASPLTAAVIVG